MLKMLKVWYPEHLPQVRVSEAEGDVGDVEALGLGLARPSLPSLLIAPTSCPSAQGLRVRGHGCQSILLAAGEAGDMGEESSGGVGRVGWGGKNGDEGRWNNNKKMGNKRWENERV